MGGGGLKVIFLSQNMTKHLLLFVCYLMKKKRMPFWCSWCTFCRCLPKTGITTYTPSSGMFSSCCLACTVMALIQNYCALHAYAWASVGWAWKSFSDMASQTFQQPQLVPSGKLSQDLAVHKKNRYWKTSGFPNPNPLLWKVCSLPDMPRPFKHS